MKKYFFLTLLTTCTLLITSCSKDGDADGVENATVASVIGEWNLTALEANDGRSEITVDGQTIVTEFEAVGKDFDTVVNFSEEPQTVTSEGSYTTVLTTSFLGETETEEVEGENFFETTDWRLDGSILYFGTGIEEQGFTITRLTDSQMDLRLELVEEVEAFGFVTVATATYTMTLSR